MEMSNNFSKYPHFTSQSQSPGSERKSFSPGRKIAVETELQGHKGNRMGLVSVHQDFSIYGVTGIDQNLGATYQCQ